MPSLPSPRVAPLAWRLAVGLALGLAPLWCAAAWEKLGRTNNVTLYIDRSTLRNVDDDTYSAWEVQDLKVADPDGVRSRRYLHEVNCKYKMYRIGKMTSFSGPLLTGKKLFEVEEFGYWNDIPPKGLFSLTYAIHCGR